LSLRGRGAPEARPRWRAGARRCPGARQRTGARWRPGPSRGLGCAEVLGHGGGSGRTGARVGRQPAVGLGKWAGIELWPGVTLGRRDLDEAREEQWNGSRRRQGQGTRIRWGIAPGRQPGWRRSGGQAGGHWAAARCGKSGDRSTTGLVYTSWVEPGALSEC
jgi:hypothetical protein